jgi:hypothetical protein
MGRQTEPVRIRSTEPVFLTASLMGSQESWGEVRRKEDEYLWAAYVPRLSLIITVPTM